eukprot:COSAG06_NODE_47025_length_342_cov_1.061728_1_plen_64_part_10
MMSPHPASGVFHTRTAARETAIATAQHHHVMAASVAAAAVNAVWDRLNLLHTIDRTVEQMGATE